MADHPKRLLPLDSLRGIAALYVVGFHVLMVPHPNPPLPSEAASKAVHFGGTGVFLFFVISGFSLSFTMPRHERSGYPNLSFAVSRLFRIAPCFFAMLVVSIIRDSALFGLHFSALRTALNMSFLFNLVPGQQEGIVWASWTIGVETLFYLAFIPLYRLGFKFQVAAGAITLLLFEALECAWPNNPYLYWSFLGYFPLFILGMIGPHVLEFIRTTHSTQSNGYCLLALGICILILCAVPDLAEKNTLLRVPIGIGYFLLLIGALLTDPSILTGRLLLFFGRVSYSLYLVHAPIIFACSPLFTAVSLFVPVQAFYLSCLIITLCIVTPLAILLHTVIEKLGINFGNALFKNYSAPHPLGNAKAHVAGSIKN